MNSDHHYFPIRLSEFATQILIRSPKNINQNRTFQNKLLTLLFVIELTFQKSVFRMNNYHQGLCDQNHYIC